MPSFTAAGVVQGDGSGPLEAGTLATIYGWHLSRTGNTCAAQTPPYPKELCGTRVIIAGREAGLLYVGFSQVNLEVPPDVPRGGKAMVQVIAGGLASDPVPVEIFSGRPEVRLAEPAYAGMPVWIEVRGSWKVRGGVRYPYTSEPWGFGCSWVEMRQTGKQLIPIDFRIGGVGSGPACGSVIPGEPSKKHRLPLHARFALEQPGIYEVQYSRLEYGAVGMERRETSEWARIEVLPSTGPQRRAWLDGLLAEAPPSNPADIVAEYLPNLLAGRNARALPRIAEQTYHANDVVRRYAVNCLEYFPEQELAPFLRELIRARGPSDELLYFIQRHKSLLDAAVLAEAAAAHLTSESAIVADGAIKVLQWGVPRDVAKRFDADVIAAADHFMGFGESQALADYAVYLGSAKSPEARDILWRMVEANRCAAQALAMLTSIADPRDKSRLERLHFVTGRNP